MMSPKKKGKKMRVNKERIVSENKAGEQQHLTSQSYALLDFMIEGVLHARTWRCRETSRIQNVVAKAGFISDNFCV